MDTTLHHNGKDFAHVECISDFAGNSQQCGFWADLWQAQDGSRLIAMGGGWEFYGISIPDVIDDTSRHFRPFLKACERDEDLSYAKKHFPSQVTA